MYLGTWEQGCGEQTTGEDRAEVVYLGHRHMMADKKSKKKWKERPRAHGCLEKVELVS
jgi:hypothetical protein